MRTGVTVHLSRVDRKRLQAIVDDPDKIITAARGHQVLESIR
jgi:hypothetical protein